MSSSIIKLNTKNCQSCYKCIRECPVKAIEFKDNKAQVIPGECVLCGRCVECCPQNARILRDDLSQVRQLVGGDKPVYLSLAPSWVSWFRGKSFSAVSAALKRLGFCGVEETAIGAAECSRSYGELMRQGQMKNIIATACPSAVMLVERHYPELIKLLAPVSSPMMAHAKLMRESYGDIKVVFAGPCLSKMEESDDPLAGGMVNFALTFEALGRWLEEEGIELGEEDPEAVGVKSPVARLYPKPTGILKTMAPEDTAGYTPIAVDGPEKCIALLDSIRDEQPEGLFIEMNLCPGGCMGGPLLRMHHRNATLCEALLTERDQAQDRHVAGSAKMQSTYPRVFQNRAPQYEEISEEDIRRVLESIGKFGPEDELNCSSCGYPTCRDKAIAVLRGKADVSMCMPYLRQRAENISSMVIEHSPNAIIAFDEEMNVIELNPRAEEIYGVKRADVLGTFMAAFYGEDGFEQARESERPIEKKVYLDELGRSVEKSIVYIKEHRMYLAFVKDISEQQHQAQKLEEMRHHTVETAQKVIDKQMRVAQEIASLLGETTAETKVALTNLKRSMTEAQSEESR
ncbi:[Fe-Fe] hydrogenase large subunit C-terminal domain-containing protein [Harryflintia acetispora]|uniref:[Fe-Fe] hydrogenase large subunit C-terminal domain-containing protein n=1 Tax=Harryflintia acetispora TaxID=1849041 RepID=UPI001898B81C|nr:[Fe-Fe] hydrogenase large subunit C-terminal domain-containing protein [Harryflintia acetispora]